LKEKKYQVFLSSTYSDLKEEREGIIKAILELYHIPIGMEMFSAEDEDQWEIIRRTIEVSDYYILVLGLRYGSKTSDGISFTHKEYEYALQKKIPILAFVMDDMISLAKDKRDDDLSEITKFRDTVLKNSKMAQFWKAKDELVKNVSVSLMKQIFQKPGTGWVRGDTVTAPEDLTRELTKLSVENRELREKIVELESKISPKTPRIEVAIHPVDFGHVLRDIDHIPMPQRLELEKIPPHLLEYISAEDVSKYNESLPGQAELDRYNEARSKIYKASNFSRPLSVYVENNGSAKASNIFIEIEFPPGILVYEKGGEFERPQNPLPANPVKNAELKYEKSKSSSAISAFGIGSVANQASIMARNDFMMPNLGPLNRTWWTRLKVNKLTIKLDSLLHTRQTTFDDEYMITPLTLGPHSIKIEIICEEYNSIETRTIDINV
jgi:hypothetical protein